MVLRQLVVPERVQIIGDGREGDRKAVFSLLLNSFIATQLSFRVVIRDQVAIHNFF